MTARVLLKHIILVIFTISICTLGVFSLYRSSYNERTYHSFGSKFGNTKLYASDSDILATDMANNALWKIPIAKYDIKKGFASNNIDDILWIVDNAGLAPNDQSKLLIFNERGELIWQRFFDEFIVTGSLKITSENYLTINLLGNRQHPVDCHYFRCKIEKPEQKELNILLALNMSNGKTVWQHNLNQYYNNPYQEYSAQLDLTDQSKIHLISGSHHEVINSESGNAESNISSVYIDSSYELQVDHINKKVNYNYMEKSIKTTLWSLDQNSELYKIISSPTIVDSRWINHLKTVLFVSRFPDVYMIERSSGKILSKYSNNELVGDGPQIEHDGVLIGHLEKMKEIGDVYAMSSKNGKILWVKKDSTFNIRSAVIINGLLNAERLSIGDQSKLESIKIDIHTGKEVN